MSRSRGGWQDKDDAKQSAHIVGGSVGSSEGDLHVLLDFLAVFPHLSTAIGWGKLTANTDLASLRLKDQKSFNDSGVAFGSWHCNATSLKGVSVNEAGRVTMIHLPRQNLQGAQNPIKSSVTRSHSSCSSLQANSLNL
jgi:hypothetical protein